MWNYSSKKIAKIINESINENEWFVEAMFLGGDVFNGINKTKNKVIVTPDKNIANTIRLFQKANMHKDVIVVNQPFNKLILMGKTFLYCDLKGNEINHEFWTWCDEMINLGHKILINNRHIINNQNYVKIWNDNKNYLYVNINQIPHFNLC